MHMQHQTTPRWHLQRYAGALTLGIALASIHPLAQAQSELTGQVLSGRADTITGGEALLRIQTPPGSNLNQLRVQLNGADITASFVANPALGQATGLVTGLTVGNNMLTASLITPTHRAAARGLPPTGLSMSLQNHPNQGPVFSGPHQQPYACATQSFTLPVIGGNLGPALDVNCNIARRVDYFYRTTANAFAAWPAAATAYPANMARTTTTLNADVPYIVRMETGTTNRAVYQSTVLHDPLTQPAPSWQQPPANWNGRLVYTFGGGCIGGWYRQGASTGGVTDNFMLGKGYAMASSTLNVFGNNCNDLTAAEAMMMVKERFIEAYGPPRHTQGFGCSGGSYVQHQIADNYPGLLDGIIPGCSFPEVLFATTQFITDAWLLDNYFTTRAGVSWSDEQKRRVTGFQVYATAPNVAVGARRIDPKPGSTSCAAVPEPLRYNPATNPTGVRCTVYDHTVNNFGRDPATGFARRPLDNVGVQYGYRLMQQGVIGMEQFIDLNEKVGGFDIDATILPPGQRTVADLQATRAGYTSGRMANGGGGLASIPIIDYRAFNDEVASGDIHVRYHSFSMRERLQKANGRSDNHVMVVEDNRFGLYGTNSPLLQRMILLMDDWVTAIRADTRAITAIEKVVQNKPASLQEGCNTRDATPSFINQRQVRDPATSCEQLYPSNSYPREVAGASIAADIVKCQTKPLNPADYPGLKERTQWARLKAIFPSGVCDWTQPGVEQQGLAGTWQRF